MDKKELKKRRVRAGRFVFALALVAALLVAYVPAPVASAAVPGQNLPIPYTGYVDVSATGKAKVFDIGHGLKVKPVNVKLKYNPKGNKKGRYDTYIKLSLKISGTARDTGFYVLGVYYKGRRIGAMTDSEYYLDYGYGPAKKDNAGIYGNIDFSVVTGKVKATSSRVTARMDARLKKMDLSKLKIKCEKFIPGCSVDISDAVGGGKADGMDVSLYDVRTYSKTQEGADRKKPINKNGGFSSALFVVEKNASVRFYAEGESAGDGAKATGMMTVTVDAGGQTASGSVFVDKGLHIGSTRGVLVACGPPLLDNWVTDAVPITKDVKVTVKSLALTPFSLSEKGAGKALPVGNGIYAKVGYYDYDSDWNDDEDKEDVFLAVDFDLNGTAIRPHTLHNVRINYTGDASNFDFSGKSKGWSSKVESNFVVADKYTFTGNEDMEESLYFKIPVKDPMKPVAIDLSKLTLTYTLDENLVKVKSTQFNSYGYQVCRSKRQGVALSLYEYYSPKGNSRSPVLNVENDDSDDSSVPTFGWDYNLYGHAKKGGTMKMVLVSDGRAKKSGTIKYTLLVNGKAYKTGKVKVKKGKLYDMDELRAISLKLDRDVTLKLVTKFSAAK